MIFVTVGTHEQPFDRLIRQIDELLFKGVIEDSVFIQTGYSNYKPKACNWSQFIPYSEMQLLYEDARIIITHGGPSSFIPAVQIGKIPIVVPRQKQFGEHVNDHQLEFAKQVAKRWGSILVVEDINALERLIVHYDELIKNAIECRHSNNARFNEELKKQIDVLMNANKK